MKRLKNILLFTFLSLAISGVNAESISPMAVEANDVEISKLLKEAEVYPNPAEDFIYLKINDQSIPSEVKIDVMSIIGNDMNTTHEKVQSGLYKINLKNIPSGHYYVILTIDSEKSLKKFLKK